MTRQTFQSGTKWEEKVAYSRAVRVGNVVEVAGTTAIDENGEVVGRNDAYEQTRFIFKKIAHALEQVGAGMQHVTRVRMYVTDITPWEEIGKAHREVFEGINPASTMVEISGLVDERLMVEIEVSAIVEA